MRVERCVALVDRCGFTAFSEHHGDEKTVARLAAFRRRVREIAARRRGSVTMWLGHGAMLSSPACAWTWEQGQRPQPGLMTP